ncbi:hypothetical protein [Desulfurobacterium atlanticum]|uniref:Uncharacterized protein n=1 Tax=Desulfurobacterium atlanticum TaxID=240169 RepID=A0A238YCI7_9BACT|nr:hypothetical protein [Desulfurobacterium atlanticum]SNR68935.1 hypothetical protein SAMN06265340_10347 [Desulfurobacterium atlanticum]
MTQNTEKEYQAEVFVKGKLLGFEVPNEDRGEIYIIVSFPKKAGWKLRKIRMFIFLE